MGQLGRRTLRFAWITAGLLSAALVFGALYVGHVAATCVIVGTGSAIATVWSWNAEGRPGGSLIIGAVVLATLVVVVVAAVGVARYT